MDVELFLALRIEGERARLAGIAYRLLGDYAQGEEAVHEAWQRAAEAGFDNVDDLSGWLTTLVARTCLDRLRARADAPAQAPADPHGPAMEPEQEEILAECVGLPELVVLGRLPPEERVALVLHDMFELEADEIAPALGLPPEAALALALRARARAYRDTAADPALRARLGLVERFLAASRSGDAGGMIDLLHDDIVFLADPARKAIGTCEDQRGREKVAHAFKGRLQFARTALLDGEPGILVAPRGRLLHVFRFTFADDRIAAIEAVADPASLAAIDLAVVG